MREYTAESLIKLQFVPLAASLPLLQCSGTDDLVALAQGMQLTVDHFSHLNVFNDIDVGGRWLPLAEPLEPGALYCLLAKNPLPHLLDALGTVIEKSIHGTWNYMRLALPRTITHQQKSLLQQILGHQVGAARPSLALVSPCPHHVDSDGTLVYPEDVETLYVRVRNSIGPNEVQVVDGLADDAVQWLEKDWAAISITGAGHCTIALDGVQQFSIRRERCAQFAPGGPLLTSKEHAPRNLFELSSDDAPSLTKQPEIRIINPTERVAAFVGDRNRRWQVAGMSLVAPGSQSLPIDAAAFGSIDALAEGLLSATNPVTPTHARTWVEGVLCRHGGADAVSWLPWRIRPNPHAMADRLAKCELHWLQNHINFAAGRVR